MAKVLPDSSCLVALLSDWHEHHDVTRTHVKRLRGDGYQFAFAAHSVAETYAVLTGLPSRVRIAASQALMLLRSVCSSEEIICLLPNEYWQVLEGARDRDIVGGTIHDAVIAACARKAGCATILTWNLKHFRRFEDATLRVHSPHS